mmetsp:Transcript_11921/g.21642  ORF Transcript_11921/g.21642 Transcript_11921/m.21642 type:complete len:223 (+) Transcript_11921:1330-1998(+)
MVCLSLSCAEYVEGVVRPSKSVPPIKHRVSKRFSSIQYTRVSQYRHRHKRSPRRLSATLRQGYFSASAPLKYDVGFHFHCNQVPIPDPNIQNQQPIALKYPAFGMPVVCHVSVGIPANLYSKVIPSCLVLVVVDRVASKHMMPTINPNICNAKHRGFITSCMFHCSCRCQFDLCNLMTSIFADLSLNVRKCQHGANLFSSFHEFDPITFSRTPPPPPTTSQP